MQYAWQRLADLEDIYYRRVDLALRLSQRMDEIVHRTTFEWNVSGADWVELRSTGTGFFRVYNQVALDAIERGQLLFDITSKLHYLKHCILQAQHLHPSISWCYSGEDYMHRARTLTQSCVKGNPVARVSLKFLEKWRFSMHFSWEPDGPKFRDVAIGSESTLAIFSQAP